MEMRPRSRAGRWSAARTRLEIPTQRGSTALSTCNLLFDDDPYEIGAEHNLFYLHRWIDVQDVRN